MEEIIIGSLLKQKRTSLGVTLEQVAEDTNIPPYFVEALEEEQFERIPGESYVKGFLRTYCHYLEIDPEQVVGIYNERYGNGKALARPSGSRTRSSGRFLKRFRWHLLPTTGKEQRENLILWLIICGTLLAMWVLYYLLVLRNIAT
jgi:cytoskeletal protein RodZ